MCFRCSDQFHSLIPCESYGSIIAVQKEKQMCVHVCVNQLFLSELTQKHPQDVLDRLTHFVLNTHTHKDMHFLHCDFSVLFCKRHTFFFFKSEQLQYIMDAMQSQSISKSQQTGCSDTGISTGKIFLITKHRFMTSFYHF